MGKVNRALSSSSSNTSTMSLNVLQNPPIDPKVLLNSARMYETKYPLDILVKSAPGILRNAKSYDSEGSREDAFILYSRFVDLVANYMANHPDLIKSKASYKIDKSSKAGQLYHGFTLLLPDLSLAMERSESIMNEIKKEYEDYRKVELARQELRDLQKRKFHEKKEREDREFKERMKILERRKSSMHSEDKELFQKLRSLSNNSGSDFGVANKLEVPSYPQLNDIAILEEDDILPNKQFLMSGSFKSSIPDVSPIASNLTYSISQQKSNIDANHKTMNYTEGGAPLRTVFLPADLCSTFTKISQNNTDKNLETCGILIGKLNRNAFFITHLLIPQQDSTSDTCATKNEETMFEYIDNEDPDLFILGWIHTHPTQSCFLSSIDLHTQNSYQIMLNEAIAIVVAPSDKHTKKLGVFRLTDPPGVPTITNCNKSGFHPHEEPNLYVECNRISNTQAKAGHVVVQSGLSFKVKDLR